MHSIKQAKRYALRSGHERASRVFMLLADRSNAKVSLNECPLQAMAGRLTFITPAVPCRPARLPLHHLERLAELCFAHGAHPQTRLHERFLAPVR